MLAEKFILLMETLKSHASPDGAPRVASTSRDRSRLDLHPRCARLARLKTKS
jgi:hypothetical protein